MRKAEKKVSTTKLRQTSDTTVFLEKEPDKDSESEGEYVSPDEDPKPSPLIRKFSSRKLDCILLSRCDKSPAEPTIHAIEKEINRHTAQVKAQKAVEHLTAPVSPSSKTQLDSDRSPSPYVPTELLTKTSSVDMGIKQLLIKPVKKPSLSRVLHVPTKKKLVRKLQKEAQSAESLLKINPFKLNKELDMLELREMLHQGKRSRYGDALPRITDDKARRQYQVFNDRRLLAPVFNFCKTAHMEEGKKKVTYADLEMRDKTEPPQLFHFRDVPQLLAVTRKNRRMYRENKWDVMRRVRETNQCSISLAIKRRMIDYLNSSVRTFSKEITAVEEETEQFARAFDDFLRENDEQSIQAIHRARRATEQRQAAAARCLAIEMRNNLIVNHNIRTEEKIRLLDRFINLCYAIVPEETKTENLKKVQNDQRNYNQERFGGTASVEADPSFSLSAGDFSEVMLPAAPLPLITIEAHSEDFTQTKSISESLLVHHSLSSESEAEYSSAPLNDPNPVFVEEALTVPPVPFPNVSSALQTLADFRAKCLGICTDSHAFREETKQIKQKMLEEKLAAEETTRQSSFRVRALQEEVDALTDRLDTIESTIALYKSGPQSREEFLKPFKQLSEDITDVYRTRIESIDQPPTVELMLVALRKRLTEHQLKFKAYPSVHIQRWYETVVINRAAEEKAVMLEQKHQRAEQAMAERALQGADVMPRRQLRPRSEPPDNGKKVVIEIKTQPAMLDVMVEELENEVNREDEAVEGLVDEGVSQYFDEEPPTLPTIEEDPIEEVAAELAEPMASVSTDSLPHITSMPNLFSISDENLNTEETLVVENNPEIDVDAVIIQMTKRTNGEILVEENTEVEVVNKLELREDSIHPKLSDIFSEFLDESKPKESKKSEKASLARKGTSQPTEDVKGGKGKGQKGRGAKKSQASAKKKNSTTKDG